MWSITYQMASLRAFYKYAMIILSLTYNILYSGIQINCDNYISKKTLAHFEDYKYKI